jgi:hypothetical protein
MTIEQHQTGAKVLATIGVLILVAGLVLHWWRPDVYRLEMLPIIIGSALAFAGFYAMDPAASKDGGGFFVDQSVKILGAIRLGRRASDPVVAVPASVPAAASASDGVAAPAAPAQPVAPVPPFTLPGGP